MLGSGTAEDPYQVATAEDLDDVRNNMSAYYIQTADIDLSSIDWCPLGADYTDRHLRVYFTGNYDGQDHIITNLTINCAEGSSNYNLDSYTDGFGLFYQIGTSGQNVGEVKNLKIIGASIKGISTIGILCGYNMGKVDNVEVSGSIEGYEFIGGIAGYSYEPVVQVTFATRWADITNCKADIQVVLGPNTSDWFCGEIGGLAGVLTNLYTSKCYAKLIFTDTNEGDSYSTTIGGLAGWSYGASYNVSGSSYLEHSVIEESCSYLEVNGYEAVGGFIGENAASYIKDCYAMGKIANSDGNGQGFGGFTGIDNPTTLGGYAGNQYINCYCVTLLDCAGDFVGPFIGKVDHSVTLVSCYYDSEICGVVDNGFGVGKTTTEMKTQETFSNWDFNTIWGVTDSYPYLLWSVTSLPLQTGKDYVAITPFVGGTMVFGGKEYKFVKYLERFEKEVHAAAGISRTYEYGGPNVTYDLQPYVYLASGITDKAAAGGFSNYLADAKRTVVSNATVEQFVNFYYIYPALPQVEKPVWVKKVITWKDVAGATAYEVKLYLDTEAQCVDTQLVGPGIQRYDFTYFIETFMPPGDYFCTVQALAAETIHKGIVWVDTDGATSYTVNLYNTEGEIVYADSVDPGVQTYDFTAIIPTLPTGTNYYGVAIPVIPE